MRFLRTLPILLLCFLLLGCSAQKTSDDELIRQMAESGVLADWYSSDELTLLAVKPSKGIDYLRSASPEFNELMNRESGIDSIRELAPEIAVEYLQKKSYEEAFIGMCLIKLVSEMHPDLGKEMNDLAELYPLPPAESKLPTTS